MRIIYAIVIRAFYLGIFIASAFHKKAALWIVGRKHWEDHLMQICKAHHDWIWFHCASLGEYEDCCEVFLKIRRENAQKKTILTFSSPSGFEAMKGNHAFDQLMYLPLDTRQNAKRFVNILQPKAVLFSRSELWFNYLNEISKNAIPLFLLSLKMNATSSFIKWPLRSFYKKCFSAFQYIYCQDKLSQALLSSQFGLQNTQVTGNTRFERIYKQSRLEEEFPFIEDFCRNNFVIVAGSYLQSDLKLILATHQQFGNKNIKWILVPHEVNESEILRLKEWNPQKVLRYSEADALLPSHNTLIIDQVGVLKKLYKFADFAIIGGGFKRMGIHNIIEPAVYGIPVAFGPNHRNYQEALDLLEMKAAAIFDNSAALVKILEHELTRKDRTEKKAQILRYVKANIADSNVIIASIRSQFPKLI